MSRSLLSLLGRYRAVFSAAWDLRDQLAGPHRLADEIAFLPAALALQETPVHPAPRRTMWAIVALFTVVVAWACVSHLEIVAIAPGRVVVSDGTKLVQPLEAAIVKTIHVRDGDRVRTGQLLVELDPTTASADRDSVQAQVVAVNAEFARASALMAVLATKAAQAGAPPQLPDDQGRAEWADMAARLARLDADIHHREAEGSTAQEALAKLEITAPLARQRELDMQGLANQGFISSHAGQDRTRERIEIERDQATQRARVRESEAALNESRHAKASYLAETRRLLSDRLTKARLDKEQLAQQSAKTAHRERITRLVSPVDGTVQQLAVRSAGGVVTPAQALLVVVPDDAEVTAEVSLENRDVGFVQIGQTATVKVDAFNFTRYGTLPATVTRLSRDAVMDEKRGPLFTATLRFVEPRLQVDGKAMRLTPGLVVTGEISTGKRRVISYLLDPLQASLQQSGRER